ncbi:hypothetical protein [Phormidium nigroviride]
MKIQEQTLNRPATSTRLRQRDSMSTNLGILVASVLTTLGLAGVGFSLYQKFEYNQANDSSYSQTQVKNSDAITQSNPSPAVQNQLNSSVQPAFGGKAQIKILSVYRLEGKPDEVTVEMRIDRVAENNVGASDIIDPGAIEGRNPNTSETYTAVDPFQEASNPISLSEMRPEERRNAYVVLKVPSGMNAIDIFVPNAAPFRNIAIANSNLVTSSASSLSKTPPEPVREVVPSKSVKFASNSQGIKLDKFTSNAYGNKAKIELLSVKRIQDPETDKRDVVNVQMRIRRLTDDRAFKESISIGDTTARDRQTTQVYKSLDPEQSTGQVLLGELKPGASADAYVWLRVPEEVSAIDIYVPQTQAFQNVPIAN